MNDSHITPVTSLEYNYFAKGYNHVAGVDEAGRGPLAGPVTAGCILLRRGEHIVDGVKDSKYMSPKQREKVFVEITKQHVWGFAIQDASDIDQLGIAVAVRIAMERAVNDACSKLQSDRKLFVLVDGSRTLPINGFESVRILRGGLYHYTISAGSIIAKVMRNRIMNDYDNTFPEYGFIKNKGYGTKAHLEALKKYGPSPIHRFSYEPVRSSGGPLVGTKAAGR